MIFGDICTSKFILKFTGIQFGEVRGSPNLAQILFIYLHLI